MNVKLILLFALLANVFCQWPHFKTCDSKWGNDKLWVDSIRHVDYTFCNDEQTGRDPTFFNAKLMTLTADGLRRFGVSCGNAECTPGAVNSLIINLGKDGFIKYANIQSADGLSKNVNVNDYLSDHILLNSFTNTAGEAVWYVVVGQKDKNTLLGIDHKGEDVEAPVDQLTDYMGWKVLKQSEEFELLKFLQ